MRGGWCQHIPSVSAARVHILHAPNHPASVCFVGPGKEAVYGNHGASDSYFPWSVEQLWGVLDDARLWTTGLNSGQPDNDNVRDSRRRIREKGKGKRGFYWHLVAIKTRAWVTGANRSY